MCVCAYMCAHSQPCLYMFLPSQLQVTSPPWHFFFQSNSCGIPSGSPSLIVKLGSFASLLTCSIIESMASALGSTHLHTVPVLSILFGFSLGSNIVPGVTWLVAPTSKARLVGSLLLIRHQSDSDDLTGPRRVCNASPVTGWRAAPQMAEASPP